MKKILTFLIVMFLFNINVSAASLCSYQEQTELNSKAANIKVSYEIVEETIEFEDGESSMKLFKIEILNVTDEFYVLIKNDVTKDEKIYYSSDAKDGVITFDWDYAETVTNFTIQVYTTNNTNCAEEKYKTFYLTTPRYNEFYNIETCQELTDFYLCQEYVTFGEISREKFLTQINNYKNGDVNNEGENPVEPTEPKVVDKIFEFIDNNKLYIISGFLVITAIGFGIYRVRTKKQRELGL